MSDAAAFKATFAGFRSLTGGGYRVCFDFDGPEIKTALEVLTHGEKPSVAKGTWFGIARLNIGELGEDSDESLKSGPHALTSVKTNSTEGKSASGPHKPSPARSLSQEAFLLCNQPRGRVYLERRRQHAIPANNHINNVDDAKHVLRAWLEIDSLSELDRNPAAADRWERIEADYKTWLVAAEYVPWPGDHT